MISSKEAKEIIVKWIRCVDKVSCDGQDCNTCANHLENGELMGALLRAVQVLNCVIDDSENEKVEDYKFPYVLGEECDMLVDGVWHRGVIVDGYRFRDGIVTIEDENGQRYWCGDSRTDVYKPVVRAV